MAIGTSSLYLHLLSDFCSARQLQPSYALINCGPLAHLQHVASFHLGHFSFTADLLIFIWRQSLILPELRRKAQLEPRVLSLWAEWWRPEEAVAGGSVYPQAWEQIHRTLDLQQGTNCKCQLTLTAELPGSRVLGWSLGWGWTAKAREGQLSNSLLKREPGKVRQATVGCSLTSFSCYFFLCLCFLSPLCV